MDGSDEIEGHKSSERWRAGRECELKGVRWGKGGRADWDVGGVWQRGGGGTEGDEGVVGEVKVLGRGRAEGKVRRK
jgi:hypothetical protein